MDYTFTVVLIGTMFIGFLLGTLGAFSVFRKESLLGDTISHASFPGIVLMFLLTNSKSSVVLSIGAFVFAVIGSLAIKFIFWKKFLKHDAALGIVLSVFFGFGSFLMSIVQKMNIPNKSSIHKFLFGNVSTMLMFDVVLIVVVSLLCFLLLILFWKEFKLITFNYEFARSIGLNVKNFDYILSALIMLAIIMGIQMSGVILMSAVLVSPAVAARQWTENFGIMVILSGIFGALFGVISTFASDKLFGFSPGPTIVILANLWLFLSILFAPNRGIAWDANGFSQ